MRTSQDVFERQTCTAFAKRERIACPPCQACDNMRQNFTTRWTHVNATHLGVTVALVSHYTASHSPIPLLVLIIINWWFSCCDFVLFEMKPDHSADARCVNSWVWPVFPGPIRATSGGSYLNEHLDLDLDLSLNFQPPCGYYDNEVCAHYGRVFGARWLLKEGTEAAELMVSCKQFHWTTVLGPNDSWYAVWRQLIVLRLLVVTLPLTGLVIE